MNVDECTEFMKVCKSLSEFMKVYQGLSVFITSYIRFFRVYEGV